MQKKGWLWFGVICLGIGTFLWPFWRHHAEVVPPHALTVEIHRADTAETVVMSMPVQTVRPASGTLSPVSAGVLSEDSTPAASSVAAPMLLTDGQLQFSLPKAIPAEHPETVTNPVVSSEGVQVVPVAWVVRAGSFENEDYAKQFVGRLRVAGFEAYTRTLSVDAEVVCRVYIGPEIDRARIRAIVQKLKQQFSVDGVVEQYAMEAST